MLDPIEAAAARRRLARRGVSPDARPQPTMRTGSDCLPQIHHIVILMMENHSYDNYLGIMAVRCFGTCLLRSAQAPPVYPAAVGRVGPGATHRDTHKQPPQLAPNGYAAIKPRRNGR